LHAGDFGNGPADDLMLADPDEDPFSALGDGAFGVAHVLYGSTAGLTASGSVYLDVDALGFQPQYYDQFGTDVTSGDFNGDGFADFAVENYVVNGSATGLVLSTAIKVTFPETAGALAAGNFGGTNCPVCDDLAIADANYDPMGVVAPLWSGRVIVHYGTASGLQGAAAQIWSQEGKVPDVPAPAEFFGLGLTARDFGDDGFDDLAIGVPGENPDAVPNAGAVAPKGTSHQITGLMSPSARKRLIIGRPAWRHHLVGDGLTGAELEAIAKAQNVSVEPGDALLVYSGRHPFPAHAVLYSYMASRLSTTLCSNRSRGARQRERMLGQNGLTMTLTVAGAPAVRSPVFTPRNAFSAAAPSAAAFVTAATRAWYAAAFGAVNFSSIRPSDAIALTEFPPVRFVIW
jgi:hypothetical protein